MLIAAIFAFLLHCSQLFRGEKFVPCPLSWKPLAESEIEKNLIFLEITIFLGQKIDKTGTDSK